MRLTSSSLDDVLRTLIPALRSSFMNLASAQALLNATKRMTVPLLKDVLKELNNLSDGIPRWPLTGKKQNLVDRVGKHLGSLKDAGRDDLYNRARGCLERVYGSKIAAKCVLGEQPMVE